MRKIFLLALIPICLQANAQLEENNQNIKGFQKDKLFTGGSVNLNFSSGVTMLGITPQLGYSLTNWADAGINFNLNYISQRDNREYGDKLRQTTYGPGAFVRLFPVNFIFGTAQYEYNIIRQKYLPATNGSYQPFIQRVNSGSLLVGGGYAGGRQRGSNSYYYLSVMWDVAGDPNSPYIDGAGRSNPVIRAGYNIGLFQGGRR